MNTSACGAAGQAPIRSALANTFLGPFPNTIVGSIARMGGASNPKDPMARGGTVAVAPPARENDLAGCSQ